jgi:hypothetical protein
MASGDQKLTDEGVKLLNPDGSIRLESDTQECCCDTEPIEFVYWLLLKCTCSDSACPEPAYVLKENAPDWVAGQTIVRASDDCCYIVVQEFTTEDIFPELDWIGTYNSCQECCDEVPPQWHPLIKCECDPGTLDDYFVPTEPPPQTGLVYMVNGVCALLSPTIVDELPQGATVVSVSGGFVDCDTCCDKHTQEACISCEHCNDTYFSVFNVDFVWDRMGVFCDDCDPRGTDCRVPCTWVFAPTKNNPPEGCAWSGGCNLTDCPNDLCSGQLGNMIWCGGCNDCCRDDCECCNNCGPRIARS